MIVPAFSLLRVSSASSAEVCRHFPKLFHYADLSLEVIEINIESNESRHKVRKNLERGYGLSQDTIPEVAWRG